MISPVAGFSTSNQAVGIAGWPPIVIEISFTVRSLFCADGQEVTITRHGRAGSRARRRTSWRRRESGVTRWPGASHHLAANRAR